MKRSRILIADDHLLFADLCKRLLDTEHEVVGIVRDGRELLRAAAELKPELIILEIAMPVLNGLDAGEKLKQKLPTAKLLYLTMISDPAVAAEAIWRGASGYLLKTCACSEVRAAIRSVLRGGRYISSVLPKPVVDSALWERKKPAERPHQLTMRQREVLQLLAEGKAMKNIADILHMSTRTVAFHKYRAMSHLGIRSNAELIRHAIKLHLVEESETGAASE